MTYQYLLLDRKNGIATMTLNRPEKLNALSEALIAEIEQGIAEVAVDEEVRVLVLTGAGRGFCSGADTGAQAERAAMRAAGKRTAKTRHETVAHEAPCASLNRLEKPVICAVNGVAVGMGLSIAMACDIRIASEAARFGGVWVRRGLIPECGATYTMPRLVGTEKALELMWTGEIIDAAEALRIGMVGRVVPADRLMPAAYELAAKIAKGPAVAIEIAKRAVYRAQTNNLSTQLDFESWGLQVCYQTEDHHEAITALQEKREPVFRGR